MEFESRKYSKFKEILFINHNLNLSLFQLLLQARHSAEYSELGEKKQIKKAVIVFFFFFWSLYLPNHLLGDDTGFKFLKNYTYIDYNHYPQNWGIDQDENGIIYVANQAGLLIYDGVSWKALGIPEYETVRSLAVGRGRGGGKDKVFIGGVGKIGYLTPDEIGSLYFVSLVDYIETDKRNFSQIWRTYSTEQGIYFNSYEYIFRWDPMAKKMKVWQPLDSSNRFLYSFYIDGRYLIHQENVGLMEMKGDSLRLIPGGEVFAEPGIKIFMVATFNINQNNRMRIIGTRLKGFFLFDGEKINPFPTEISDYLKVNYANHGIRLSSGDYAIATKNSGLLIMDTHGGLKNICDKSYGLQDDNVKYVFEDNQKNLWLCLESGITRIEYASAISIHDERSGLPGLILSITRFNEELYVGTTKGLFYFESTLKFDLVSNLVANCWNLLSVGDSLLAATAAGVFQLDHKQNIKKKIINDKAFVLLKSNHRKNHTWCGTGDQLVLLTEKNGQWQEQYRCEAINQEIRAIAEDKKGDLWIDTANRRLFRVEFPVDIQHPVVTFFNKSHGLPEGEVFVTRVMGHVVVATPKGIFRFDEEKKRFIADRSLGEQFAGGKTNAKPVFRLVEDHNNHIWFHSQSRNYQAIPNQKGTITIYSKPFLRLPNIQVNTIYPDLDDEVVWFGSNDGLIRYDKTVKKDYDVDYKVLIREIKTNGETPIYDGYSDADSKIQNPTFAYNNRNLLFICTAPFFENEFANRYRFFLDGFDNQWTEWILKSQKEYTNLDSGSYNFRVQAKNVYGHKGREAVFAFRILPPWYKTWWAYVSYVIGLLISIFFIVKWRNRRLEHEKLRLEKLVTQRTKEIKDKNVQLENQTVKLKEQSEKLKEMDKIKSRFFANISHEFRTPLTLIMSPVEEMLSEIKEKQHRERLNLMQRSSQRLLRLINQLLDLSRIDSGKMKLQASCQDILPYLKGIFSTFLLRAQHKKIQMDFKSKPDSIPLFFDPQKIEDIMNNLLSNALKFTPVGGHILVSVIISDQKSGESLNSGFVEISVTDNGIGIPKEQLPYIFDRFFQVQGSSHRKEGHKGTGIGLAFIKELVNLHHGKINVHSAEGKGTTFVIQLPLGEGHLKTDEIVDSPGLSPDLINRKPNFDSPPEFNIREEENNKEKINVSEISKNVIGDKTEKQGKNVILVVEDNDDVRKYIRGPLEQLYTVAEARNGKEGIDVAKEIIPDLIVSDIMMPVKDGCQLCTELKKNIDTSHIPIILLTAKASEESVVQGLETGADDYITKPFNTKILLARIKNLIDLRRQMQLKIQRQKMLLPSEISVSSQDEKFLKEFQEIIEKNLGDPDFNVDELSKKLYMGRSTLFRKVQALTGETPNQFILSYRLERGARLLRENYGNVTEVAMAVGFSSPPYFAKCFKDRFHQSPSSYQASQSKSQ